jgi:hypothetical protein
MKIAKLKRLDSKFGRAYVLEENGTISFLPSVTTILSLKSSTYLKELEKKIGQKELQEIGQRAVLRGTAMHLFLENFFICMQKKGDKDSCLLYTQRKSTDSLLEEMDSERVSSGRKLFYNVFHSGIFNEIKKVISTEQFLYSKKYLFAGTTDLSFFDIKKRIVVTDFKSASSPRTDDVIEKYECQVAAYTIAFEELFQKPVDRGEIWISHDDGFQVIKLKGSRMDDRKQEFLKLCETYHSMWDITPFENLYKQTG